ncbi:MAG TPA: hypothetical protein VM163_10880 [bacterium]|nr:hypothetical protein [bacterium]
MEQATPNTAHPVGPRWPRLRRELLIILFLAAFAIAVTWPVAPRMTREIFGSWGDVNLNFWNYWWFRYAILELKQSPFFCPLQLYPYGADLAFHTLCPLNQIIALPIHVLFGIRFAYNFIVFFSLIMAAYTAYRLAFDVCGHRIAAVAAGVMFGFSPYMLVRATGHINLIGSWPLPLVVMFSMRAFKSGKFRWAALAGLFAGLQLGVSMYYTLFAAILFVLLWINAAIFERRTLRSLLWCPVVTAACALGAASPVLVIQLRSMLISGASFAPPTWMSFTGGVDLLAFFVPPEFSMTYGWLVWPAYGHLHSGCVEGLAFAGTTCLIAAVIAMYSARERSKWLWAVLALLFAVAALGDRLHILGRGGATVFGQWVFVPLPTVVFKIVPILNLIRVASRFVILYQLALVCLASLGLRYILTRFSGRHRSIAIGLLVLCLFVDYSYAPYMTMPMRFGRLYDIIGRMPVEFAVLDVPFGVGDALNWYGRNDGQLSHWLTAQTVHRKPVIGTVASRMNPGVFQKLSHNPLLHAIVQAQDGKLTAETLEELPPSVVMREVRRLNLKLIIVHRLSLNAHNEGQLAYLFKHMGFKLLYHNDEIAVIEAPLGPSLEKYVPRDLG